MMIFNFDDLLRSASEQHEPQRLLLAALLPGGVGACIPCDDAARIVRLT